MSFLSDLVEGKDSNLGHDLNPSNVFSDTQKDIGGKNTLEDILGGAAILTGGLGLAGGLPALGGLFGAADAGAVAGAPLDILAGGAAEGSADAAGGAALGFGADVGSDAAAGDSGLDAINSALGIGAGGDAAAPGSALALQAPDAAGAVSGSPIDPALYNNLPNINGVIDSYDPNAAQPSFLDKLVSGASNSLTKNPLGIAAAAGGLGLSFLNGSKENANQKVLTQEAPALAAQGAALSASGQQLQTYLTNGTLPPAMQSQVTTAVQAEKARIIQNHASNGENTNPTQNSALAQELSQADINGLNLAGQLEQQLFTSGTQLLNTGLNETGLSTQLYESLAKMDQANNTQLMTAIASMAAALGGGTKIQIGGGVSAAA